MAADNLRLQVLCLLIAVIAVTKAYDNFYEFGNYSIGEEYIRKQGSIPAFYYRLDVLVSELENKLVTGVKVVVSGPATPRVSYSRPWVYIQYHFPQWTHDRADLESSYTYLSVVTTGLVVISNPIVIFDPTTNILKLHIKYPLFAMQFFANGFSMPLKPGLRFPTRINENDFQEPLKNNFTVLSHFCVLCSQCCVHYNNLTRKRIFYVVRV
ncbi:uncharacterized protein LOC133528522 isoform X2 [Cydia pomonella]|nr:uncharacterized protein LOC133528522 isoform X2 [Cydia pomonella]